MRRRFFEASGRGLDYYPSIDKYSAEAERLATMRVPVKGDARPYKWSRVYLDAMDYLTSKAGVRKIGKGRYIALEKQFAKSD